MQNIEERGRDYKTQLSSVQARLSEFGNILGWEILNRGRKPNSGIAGMVGCYNSSIQVTALEEEWSLLPEKIEPNTEFSLWCGVFDESKIKQEEICKQSSFEDLPEELECFLEEAAKLLHKYGGV